MNEMLRKQRFISRIMLLSVCLIITAALFGCGDNKAPSEQPEELPASQSAEAISTGGESAPVTAGRDDVAETDVSSVPPAADPADYRYISRGDKHYIEFDDYGYTASGNDFYEAFDMAGLPFNSLAELKEKVTGNGLTDKEKNFIKERKDLFISDKNGIVVCDFDNLLEPEVPESLLPLEMVGGTWAGERYTAAYDSGNGVRFLFGYFTKDIFEARLEYDTHGVIDSAKNRDDCSEVTYVDGDGNTTTTEYSFAKDASKQYKHVVKSVVDSKYYRTIVIDYVRDIEKNGKEAAYNPTRAEIFFTDGRNYIFYEFSGKDGFVLPGESELLDYGFKKSDN